MFAMKIYVKIQRQLYTEYAIFYRSNTMKIFLKYNNMSIIYWAIKCGSASIGLSKKIPILLGNMN